MKKKFYSTDPKDNKNEDNLKYIYETMFSIDQNQDFNLWINDISKNGLVIHGTML